MSAYIVRPDTIAALVTARPELADVMLGTLVELGVSAA